MKSKILRNVTIFLISAGLLMGISTVAGANPLKNPAPTHQMPAKNYKVELKIITQTFQASIKEATRMLKRDLVATTNAGASRKAWAIRSDDVRRAKRFYRRALETATTSGRRHAAHAALLAAMHQALRDYRAFIATTTDAASKNAAFADFNAAVREAVSTRQTSINALLGGQGRPDSSRVMRSGVRSLPRGLS